MAKNKNTALQASKSEVFKEKTISELLQRLKIIEEKVSEDIINIEQQIDLIKEATDINKEIKSRLEDAKAQINQIDTK